MLVGGRGSVYFFEQDQPQNERYEFPRDAEKRITAAFREQNREGLMGLLDEVYRRNIRERSLPPR